MDRRSFLSLAGGVAGLGVVGSVTDALPVYSLSGFEASAAKTAPSHRWVLTVTDRYRDRERAPVDGPVADAADLDAEAAAFLRAAVTDDDGLGLTQRAGRDALPDGFRRALSRHEAFTGLPGSARLYQFSLWRRRPDRDPALRFDAELRDDRVAVGNPGRVALSVTNRSDESRTLFTGSDSPPFGHLWAERTDTDGERTVYLWRPDSPFAHLLQLPVGVQGAAIDYPVAPGEVRTRQYELRAGDLSLTPGEYEVSDVMYYRASDAPRESPYATVEWRVEFEVE